MMTIDYEDMTMPTLRVKMGVTVGFRPLPALMFMLVVLVMVMPVGVLDRRVIMLESHRVP